EDGIRVFHVTGVQTCALPIYRRVRVDPALLDPVRPSHRGGRTTGPRSVEAFDDAEVALEAVGEFGQRLLVGRTLVRGDRLFEARSEERRVGTEGRCARVQDEL